MKLIFALPQLQLDYNKRQQNPSKNIEETQNTEKVFNQDKGQFDIFLFIKLKLNK